MIDFVAAVQLIHDIVNQAKILEQQLAFGHLGLLPAKS